MGALFCVVVLPAVLWENATLAQSCDRSCAASMRDAHGCCPAAAPVIRTAPAPARPAECQDGKAISPDTAGHCCWAGQVWASGRCVGVPTACPDPRVLVAKAQECMIPQCPTGTVRTDDKIHCCWPGQGWSITRQACVGLAQCPRGFEAEGEGCVSEDKDKDGILNARDKCPDDPEDVNGFEDADGCPDEPRRLAALAAVEQQRITAEQEKARAAQEVEQLELKKQADAAAAARAAELARKQAEDQAARAQEDWEHAVAHAHTRRTVGLVLTGAGLLAGAGSFIFMGLGGGENGSIRSGGFSTGSAISDAASSGSTDNAAAVALGVGGLVLCGVGVPVWLSGLSSPEKPKSSPPAVSVSPMQRGAGVLTTVHFE